MGEELLIYLEARARLSSSVRCASSFLANTIAAAAAAVGRLARSALSSFDCLLFDPDDLFNCRGGCCGGRWLIREN